MNAATKARKRLLLRQSNPQGLCHWCGTVMLRSRRARVGCHPMSETIDHIIPVARDGGNGMGNLCLAHRKCNMDKADQDAPEPAVALPKKENKMAILCEAIRRTA